LQFTTLSLSWVLAGIPLLVGGLLAVGVWAVRRRGEVRLSGRLGAFAIVGGLLPVLVNSGESLLLVAPDPFDETAWLGIRQAQYATPVVAGIVAVAVLAIPGRRRPPGSAAEIARRTAFTFVSTGRLAGLIAATLVTIAVTVAAGAASAPDSAGRYTSFSLRLGSVTAGTTIYGWFFSLPSLAALAILLAATILALARIARPPLGEAREHEAAIRRIRSRNVVAAATAAIAFHLSSVFDSLAGTSMLAGTVPSREAGTITVRTTFAALTPVLSVGWIVLACLAVALCAGVALAAARRPARLGRVGAEAAT